MTMGDEDATVIRHLREQNQALQKRIDLLEGTLALGYQAYELVQAGVLDEEIIERMVTAINTFGQLAAEQVDIEAVRNRTNGKA